MTVYVFDSSPLIDLFKHYYPARFPSLPFGKASMRWSRNNASFQYGKSEMRLKDKMTDYQIG